MRSLLLRIAKQLTYLAYLGNEEYVQSHYVGELMQSVEAEYFGYGELVERVILTPADDGYDFETETNGDDYEVYG